ncbi:MAG: cupredoxin domain-containing protein [Actinobacteria bacterium]|nr:cupredoxin domain-containing protein [Actinomycetota bacterium]
MRRRVWLTVLGIVLALVASGCGGDDDPVIEAPATDAAAAAHGARAATDGPNDGMTHSIMGMDAMGSTPVGEPAEPSEAERTIEVTVDNSFAFMPDAFEVSAGEVVTFEIANTGDIEHEFVIGDEQMQAAMADEMASGDGHAHAGAMSNAVTIHAGETATLTWRFTEPGEVLVGCHEPGHYEGGMRATITVS